MTPSLTGLPETEEGYPRRVATLEGETSTVDTSTPSLLPRFQIACLVVVFLLAAGSLQAQVVLDLRYEPSDTEDFPNPPAQLQSEGRPPSISLRYTKDGNAAPGSEDIGFIRIPQKITRIYSTRPVVSFLDEAGAQQLNEWGVPVSSDGKLIVEGHVTRFSIEEKFVHWAEIETNYSIRGPDGHIHGQQGDIKSTGMSAGVARSPRNHRQALSDALRENLKKLIQSSWFLEAAAAVQPREAEDSSLTPAALREAVLRLMKDGLEEDLLVSYVRQARVSPTFSADDVIAWKAAGIHSPVISAALAAAAPPTPKE